MLYAMIRLLDPYVTCCVYVIVYSLIYMSKCIAWSDLYVNVYDRILVLNKSLVWYFGDIAQEFD
jgi:hypothetical protein